MPYEICPICGEETTNEHECLSYESLNHMLELEFLGLSYEMLEPYGRVASKPKRFGDAKERKSYKISNEPKSIRYIIKQEHTAPLRVSEPEISVYTPDYGFADRNVLRRSVPLFLQL